MSEHPDVTGVAAAARSAWVDDALGLQWDELGPDRVRAHVDADARHHQPYGIVHGGVHASIVETIASVGAAMRLAGRDEVVVGVSNTTDFVRPHRTGRLDAVGTPVHAGRTQQLWEVRITRGSDERLVAIGRVRLQHVPADSAAHRPGDGG